MVVATAMKDEELDHADMLAAPAPAEQVMDDDEEDAFAGDEQSEAAAASALLEVLQ
jgi:hypothetical protein